LKSRIYYKYSRLEDYKKEHDRLSGPIGQLTTIFVGLDDVRRKQLQDFAWTLMREWREEANREGN